ncbi:hypothetical protein AC249_AIPGENE10879 [Exaiptasia diaphana]|nr:hypothetical protein AC249_AIPGENE10879 [Exaiptasia diaphana]
MSNAKKSKIPRYKKSKVPVLSRSYKKILKEVKEKKSQIYFKESEMEVLEGKQTQRLEELEYYYKKLMQPQEDQEGLKESPRNEEEKCKVLEYQLQNYRALIKQRVSDDTPVITYQDNMQLMRTSLRHLRLSKLKADKDSQQKMCDFTVRGYRIADISGIENLFQKKENALEPQMSLSDLEYKDITMENNVGHRMLWEDFKKRDLLRKFDVALNDVKLNSADLSNASLEETKRLAALPEASDSNRPFKIDVPETPVEYPDLAKKKTPIFPLPISQENQCLTVGLAQNLDMFKDEFGFHISEKKKFLLLKKNNDFDLDQAYARFAFLKSLERHKEKQSILNATLRGINIQEECSLVFVEQNESDSDSSDED